MKFSIILATMLMTQVSYAQTMRDKKIKQEMLERVDLLLEKVEGAREDLKQEDVVAACGKIKEMFAIYPKHLDGVGQRLNLKKRKTITSKDDSLGQLIFIHEQTYICDKGANAEFVDPKKLRKELKEFVTSLEDQRRVIEKSDTNFQNIFNWYYNVQF